jgi:hypothetical protein
VPGEAAVTAEDLDADAGLVRRPERTAAHESFRRAICLTPGAVALLVRQRELVIGTQFMPITTAPPGPAAASGTASSSALAPATPVGLSPAMHIS